MSWAQATFMEKKDRYFHYYLSKLAGKEKACDGKINYHSEWRATKAALKMSKKTGSKFMYYPCVFCKGWHVGHKRHTEY